MTIPAGWYDDPVDATSVRYWDGTQWGPHIAPKPSAPPPRDDGPTSALHYIIPVGRSWQSIWAPYLGLFSLVCLPVVGHIFGIGGIVLGILALRRARTGGHGTGRAITGIVLGSIGTAASTLFLVMMIASQGQTA